MKIIDQIFSKMVIGGCIGYIALHSIFKFSSCYKHYQKCKNSIVIILLYCIFSGICRSLKKKEEK